MCIRDRLEGTLGVAIFKRTSKGVLPTAQGKEFLRYAKSILDQVERMEDVYKRQGLAVGRCPGSFGMRMVSSMNSP